MKLLLTRLRELFSVPALYGEIAFLKEEIGCLEDNIKQMQRAPFFEEVAKQFTVEQIPQQLWEEVLQELKPQLRTHAYAVLAQIPRQEEFPKNAYAAIAYCASTRTYRVHARIPAFSTVQEFYSGVA